MIHSWELEVPLWPSDFIGTEIDHGYIKAAKGSMDKLKGKISFKN
jgi:hypothetical protein